MREGESEMISNRKQRDEGDHWIDWEKGREEGLTRTTVEWPLAHWPGSQWCLYYSGLRKLSIIAPAACLLPGSRDDHYHTSQG